MCAVRMLNQFGGSLFCFCFVALADRAPVYFMLSVSKQTPPAMLLMLLSIAVMPCKHKISASSLFKITCNKSKRNSDLHISEKLQQTIRLKSLRI